MQMLVVVDPQGTEYKKLPTDRDFGLHLAKVGESHYAIGVRGPTSMGTHNTARLVMYAAQEANQIPKGEFQILGEITSRESLETLAPGSKATEIKTFMRYMGEDDETSIVHVIPRLEPDITRMAESMAHSRDLTRRAAEHRKNYFIGLQQLDT